MTSAIYARVGADQSDARDVLEVCRRRAEGWGGGTELYVDIDRGGGERPELHRLRDAVADGNVDRVLAADVTHLGSDLAEVAAFVRHCYEHDVAFELLDGSFPAVDPDDERADDYATLFEWAADAGEALLRERARTGIVRARRAETWTGRPPFGFTLSDGKLAIEPDEYFRMGAALDLLERDPDATLSAVARHAGIPKSSLSRVRNDPERRRLYREESGGPTAGESDEPAPDEPRSWRPELCETIVETVGEGLYATDGERTWFSGNVAPITRPDGEVEQLVAAWQDVTDRKRYEQELKRYETLVESSPDGMFALDAELRMAYVNGVVESLAGLDREEILGQSASIFLEEGVFEENDFEAGIEVCRTLLAAEEPRDETFELTLHGSDGTMETEVHVASQPELDGIVGLVRDVSERKRAEQELERQRDELRTMNRINELIQEVRRRFLGAATREEIEAVVCESLVDSDLYDVAWVGELDVSREEIVLRAGAGADDAPRRVVEAGLEGTGDRPAVRTSRTGETHTSQGGHDPDIDEGLRDEARSLGIESAVCVPLVQGETIYGSLTVCSPRPDGFSEREQAAFEVLGETIGLTIDAAETRRLLLTDRIVELAFEGRDEEDFFVDLSERLSCHCTLDGLAASTDRTLLHYVTVEGANPDRVLESAERSTEIEECRVVEEDDRTCLLEVSMRESAPKTLVQAGASVRSATADDGHLEIIAEVAAETSIRAVVETFTDAHPGTEMVRKEERERPLQTSKELRSELTDRLTDRQLASLQAAYFAGYFDWPRDSTAEEVARSMDISSPTLHRHLRKATHTLLTAFFDGRTETGDD